MSTSSGTAFSPNFATSPHECMFLACLRARGGHGQFNPRGCPLGGQIEGQESPMKISANCINFSPPQKAKFQTALFSGLPFEPNCVALTLNLCTQHCAQASHLHISHQNSTSVRPSAAYAVELSPRKFTYGKDCIMADFAHPEGGLYLVRLTLLIFNHLKEVTLMQSPAQWRITALNWSPHAKILTFKTLWWRFIDILRQKLCEVDYFRDNLTS